MRPLALGIFLIELICAHVHARGGSRFPSPSQAAPFPSKTSYNTVSQEPACTGCLLEAIQPTPLSYPGTVYCLDVYIISTVPSSIRYTVIGSDGCSSIVYSPYTPVPQPISTTSITWDVNGTSLTWPTTYVAYSTFQAGTLTYCDGECTVHPTTVYANVPIIYPASSLLQSTAPVPSDVVNSLIHDPSISLPFNIATCTPSAQPSPLPGQLQPQPSYATGPSSCIQLSPTTVTRPNTFIHSGYCHNTAPPIRRNVAAPSTAETSHIQYDGFGIVDGGTLKPTDRVSGSTNASVTTATSSTVSDTSTSGNSLSRVSSARSSIGNTFAA